LREIFEKFGLVAPLPVIAAAERVTVPSQMMNFGNGGVRLKTNPDPRRLRRDWRALLALSETPICSRAISLIVDKVSSLDWVVAPKPEFSDNGIDYTDPIKTVCGVLDNPNNEDEDWPAVVKQVVEDQLVYDFGAWEYVESPEPAPMPNDILALIPVPGWSIERTMAWKGDKHKPRWVQNTGDKPVGLLDSQLEVIIMRRRTSVSYGLAPMEVVVGLMDAYLKLSSYQADVASEAYPAFMLALGDATDQAQVDEMRLYWNNQMRGRGKPGLFGGFGDAKALQTKAITDDGLYLKYEEKLMRCAAFSFKLKPQDFSIERDVNRSQGEVSQAASIEEAIRPYAMALASRITRRVIPRIAAITGDIKILDLAYTYSNIDPWDEAEQTKIATTQWKSDGLTRGEYREKLGQPPLDDGKDDMSYSEYVSQFKPAFGADPNAPDPATQDTTNASRFVANLTAGKKKVSPR